MGKYILTFFTLLAITLSANAAETGFNIKNTQNGMKAIISNTNIFFQGTPSVNDTGKKIILALISKIPNDVNFTISVSAHTDSTAIKDINKYRYPSNWELASFKAAAVARHIDGLNLKNLQTIHIRSYSDKDPIAPNYTRSGRNLNKRIEINIVYNILKKEEVLSGVADNEDKVTKDNYSFLKKYLYSNMKACSEIQTEYIHELSFENKKVTPSRDQLNILTDIVDYIWQRGRLISVLVESHSSSFEDLLHNNKMSIQRGKFIKDILSKRIKGSIIKIIPYGDAINLTAKSKYIDANVNNRVSVSIIRCLDKYKPLF